MISPPFSPLTLHISTEKWPLTAPFKITGRDFTEIDVLLVHLEKDGFVGRGEAVGVYYRNESSASMLREIEAVRGLIEIGLDRDSVQRILKPGGARNALDCALWDLEARILRCPVWQLAGLQVPEALMTTFGCGADTPENMVRMVERHTHARAIKLKLTGEPIDVERVKKQSDARSPMFGSVLTPIRVLRAPSSNSFCRFW